MEKSFFQKYKTWILIIGFVLLIVFGSTLFSGIKRTITLNVWGSGFTEEQFDLLSKNIKSTSKNNIKFVYTEIDKDDYENDLLDSFIHSKSPDIFLINNEQLGKFKKLISPMDLSGKYNISNLQKDFPTIISDEAVLNDKLMLMPLAIDSLALYYNRNIFDSLAIPNPPKTWNAINELVPTLRQLDSYKRISRFPIGLGDSSSITNSSDILSLIILQLGGKIIDTMEQRTMVTERVRMGENYISPAEEALKFYTQFYQSNNQSYSWNRSANNDLEAFANNNLGIYIGYFSDKGLLNEKNPNLTYGISEMPQVSSNSNTNIGRFWGFTVSTQSKNKNVAWEALGLLSSPENMQSVLNFSKFPPANRTLISQYYNDPDLGIFAKQALNSKSFYHPDAKGVKDAFWKAIDSTNLDNNPRNSVEELNQNLTNLMYNN